MVAINMRQFFAIWALGLMGVMVAPMVASAESVVEKIQRTGVLTAGTSQEAAPFAYKNSTGKLTGYSIDMLELIRERMEQQVGRPVKLDLVALAPDRRLPTLIDRQVDIVCDFSSFTWKRNQQVDFSIAYATTGTQLLIKRGRNMANPMALVGQKVGVFPGTTNELAVKRTQPKAQIVLLKDLKEALSGLDAGKIDAFAWDGVLLEAEMNATGKWRDFKIVQGEPLSQEGVSCMVPEDNSRFLDGVNYALFRHMQGFIKGEPKSTVIFDRWFGPQSQLPLSRDYRDLVIETMRLAVDSREEIQE
jgi:polar amino acid transport system substrate-binding protein